ncbi:MAG: c-type cytochrome [Bacteroidota bacterium]
MFEKRTQTPIESRNYSVYYLVFSGILFLGTMWAVIDEVSTRRPWKDEQRAYYALASTRMQERVDQAIADFDSSSYLEYAAALQAAQDSMKGTRYTETHRRYNEVLESLVDERREYQFAKSRGDEAYYFYKKSVKEGHDNPGEKKKLDENEAQMAQHQGAIVILEGQRDSLLTILTEYRQNVKTVENQIDELRKNIDKWQTRLNRVDDAPIEIKQVMMLDYDRNPFNDPKARIDRCQTCHLGWREEVMEDDVPKQFKMHPMPELLHVHNPELYGCTPCHRGQGAALTAGFAHGEDDHHWENPLLKGIDAYATCNECHESQSTLAIAPVFTHAKRLMIESGCHGCHEMKGYTDLQKVGPELNRIGSKTTAEWVYRWIKNPKDHNPHTRMPNFKFTDDQAEAVTAYLMDISSKNPMTLARGSSGGSVLRGKELVASVGCMGCHVVGDEVRVRELRGTSYDIAPELSRVGSKVTADWAYDWVKNPRHYNPTTKMPSLRLTDTEARDVVAYLMTLRDERMFKMRALDLSSPATITRGEKLIREYGCNGCHAIQGMEKEGRVSVSLSNFGRKKVEEMDFGDTHVEHSWSGWVENKLKDSRIFETDRIAQKMPVFAFNDSEIALLRMFLLSQTKDEPDKKYIQAFDRKQQNIEAGRRLAIAYNCQQCHQLEKEGAYLGAVLEEAAFLPPIITGEGAKVQEPWLYSFLQNPSVTGQPNSIRPWIPTRMPTFQFSEDEISKLSKYFLGLSNQELELRDYKGYRPDPVLLPVGREIFTDFQCAKCHPSSTTVPKSGEVSTSDLAPNLTKARDRLKPEWIVEWLADPGKIQEGTRMPTYFPDGQSPLPDVLDGNARKQMQAIRDHLISIGEPARTVVTAR